MLDIYEFVLSFSEFGLVGFIDYQVLGVEKEASQREIQKAFHKYVVRLSCLFWQNFRFPSFGFVKYEAKSVYHIMYHELGVSEYEVENFVNFAPQSGFFCLYSCIFDVIYFFHFYFV